MKVSLDFLLNVWNGLKCYLVLNKDMYKNNVIIFFLDVKMFYYEKE